MPELGILTRVDLRLIWPNEAHHFTPWLAHNLGALGEALGMDLELAGQEAPVGSFSLDLLAHDLGRDRTVIIENQIEPTDHDHLGKLLTYASGFDAHAVVWIASEFREPHRQALDWLNQRTDQHTEFFGVVLEAMRIDDSRPAMNFRVVVSPNEWRKTAVGPTANEVSPRGEAYRAYFQSLIDTLRERYHFTNARKGQAQSWYSFASGLSGIVYGSSFAQGNRVRAEIYIDRPDAQFNKALFDTLYARRDQLQAELGSPLIWERLDDKRASRIATYREGSISDPPQVLEEIQEWAVDRLLALKRVFGPKMKELSTTIAGEQFPVEIGLATDDEPGI